jgi:hypothetical protein
MSGLGLELPGRIQSSIANTTQFHVPSPPPQQQLPTPPARARPACGAGFFRRLVPRGAARRAAQPQPLP